MTATTITQITTAPIMSSSICIVFRPRLWPPVRGPGWLVCCNFGAARLTNKLCVFEFNTPRRRHNLDGFLKVQFVRCAHSLAIPADSGDTRCWIEFDSICKGFAECVDHCLSSSVVAPVRGPVGGLGRRWAFWGSNAGVTQDGNSAGFDDCGLKLGQSLGRAAKVSGCQRGACPPSFVLLPVVYAIVHRRRTRRNERRKSHSGLRARLGGCGAGCAGLCLFCRFHVLNMLYKYIMCKPIGYDLRQLALRPAFRKRSPMRSNAITHGAQGPPDRLGVGGGRAGGRTTAQSLRGYRLQLASSF